MKYQNGILETVIAASLLECIALYHKKKKKTEPKNSGRIIKA